jgi:aryl-alcohol dehydrogenase-like predicted oxidoreductase
MKYAKLPAAKLKVSSVALGTAAFGSLLDKELSFRLLDSYVAAGGTFIDTAHVYADWLGGERSMSEKTIGAWLRERGKPKDVLIATKGGHPEMATSLTPRLSRQDIIDDVDGSLKFLGLQRIELYYLHRDDPLRPVGEIMETLNSQIKLGKIGAIGCSNWQISRIAEAQEYARANGVAPFAVSQLFWSLAKANPGVFDSDHALMDSQALNFYDESSLPVVAFTSQARGFFSKAAGAGVSVLKPELRKAFENPVNLARLERAQKLAKHLDVSVSAIVLAFVTSQSVTSIAIIGPHSEAQLNSSLDGCDLSLSSQHVQFLFGHTDHHESFP